MTLSKKSLSSSALMASSRGRFIKCGCIGISCTIWLRANILPASHPPHSRELPATPGVEEAPGGQTASEGRAKWR
uniref:Uncharacterized protein n=1 Tax=Arundo donax TaxID=35708 RepID=A0A0A9FHT4_ARUDO